MFCNARLYTKLHGVISRRIVIGTYESVGTVDCVQPCAASAVRCLTATPYWLIQASHTSHFFCRVAHEGCDCSFPGVLNACLMWRAMGNDRVIMNWFHLILYISSFLISWPPAFAVFFLLRYVNHLELRLQVRDFELTWSPILITSFSLFVTAFDESGKIT